MRNDAAVSPVVGTMILLTVVIILAAVVAAFAGGAAEVQQAAPEAEVAVYPAGSGDDVVLVFEHRGGDAVRTEDVKINTWVHLPDGGLAASAHTALSNRSACGDSRVRLPAVPGDAPSDTREFGKAVWRPGMIAVTGDTAATAAFLGLGDATFRECVEKEAVLEVELLHLPSGTVMQKSTMLLKEG
ncbi:type IV pilin [Methanofollis formosanus]|uniref:Type IV pilin n=1 Tax=Methanofollis formosanus TaxID=299308 RepID=A0A8G1EHI9_9EURY|nr:type IV pilin N-terminal domain-containing protein [Methanofollis formosanus]QYZ80324.1 type IV pilin [Methanofollis formosanus]